MNKTGSEVYSPSFYLEGTMPNGKLSLYSGNMVDVYDLKASDVNIQDIAHALANLCRFAGHTRHFYSVAQHSIRVMRALPRELMLEGLLHDAAEAYVIDLPRPLKVNMPDYKELEQRVNLAIAARFGVPTTMSHEVRVADERALFTEAEELMPECCPGEERHVPLLPAATVFMNPREAEGAFLIAFAEAASYRLGLGPAIVKVH